ncbi:MAG: nickel-binding protein [Bacteroidota bacterium]|nr:nickel-binding protein [Bacteroidota bacterium]
MKKYLIRREIKGASSIPKHEMNKGGKASEEVLSEMRNEGKMIQQEASYVAGNNIFCVYNADSEDLIREHAERSGGVATEITEISTVIKHNTSVVS